jgi:hypothetical protein
MNVTEMIGTFITSEGESERERETFITKLGEFRKDSEERSKTTSNEGDDLEESAARALMRHGGGGRGGKG